MSDLPLLDAARHRLGDPEASRRQRRHDATIAVERARMAQVVDHLIATGVRALSPELSKGLEFDLVVLIDPDRLGEGIKGAVDRSVAMTRATQQLVILTSSGPDDGQLPT